MIIKEMIHAEKHMKIKIRKKVTVTPWVLHILKSGCETNCKRVSCCILLVFIVKQFDFSGVYFMLDWQWIDTKYSMGVCGHVESHYADEVSVGPSEE